MPPSPPSTPDAAADSALPAAPPDSSATQRPWPGLDQLGGLQASGGLILGLIALFTSYDHISLGDFRLPIPQPWGIPLIAASVATALIDAQLATRARDRAGDRAEQAAYEANRERYLTREERQRADRERSRADQERNRAAEARERQAETAERQRKSFERLDQAALLSARVQLDPSEANRTRLRAFLTLMAQRPLDEEDAGEA